MEGLSQLLRNLGPGRLAAMGIVAAGLVGFFFFISTQLNESPLGILFTDLEMAEAAEISERLRTLQVQHEVSTDGKTIMAPTDKLPELRLQFASDGIGGSVGYELLDRQDPLGSTSFMQQVTHRRAIEGELSKTIESINLVREARVHLVMPERALFAQEQTQPSASVVLKTRGGRLSKEQVRSIRQLIAASVANLPPERISVVDQFGTLLARIDNDSDAIALGEIHDRQMSMQSALETQVESLLERTIGPGKVRAEVAVELDHQRVSSQSEVYDPEAQVVVSTSTTARNSSEADAEGGNVSVAQNLPGADGAAAGQSASSNETEETTNFQNSRTQTTTVKELGTLKRISVAVLVDGIYTTAEDGTQSYAPRSAEDLAQLERLVKSAIGFNEDRGDSIEIASMQFAGVDEGPMLEDTTSFFGINIEALERTAEISVMGIVSILVLLLVVRPIIKKVMEAAPPPQPLRDPAEIEAENRPQLAGPQSQELTPEILARAADGDDEAIEILNAARVESEIPLKQLGIDAEIDVAQVEGRLKGSALKKVGGIISKHPDESAAIVRQWLHGT